jgi:hypothetical protein
MPVRLMIVIAAMLVSAGLSKAPAQQRTLDYAFFKAKVEPIFLQKREGHTRCYICHEESNTGLRLEKLSPGATFWTEEQSQKNFAVVSALVVPGDLADSRLLLIRLRPKPAATCFTPAAASSPPRTIRTGRFWRSGSAGGTRENKTPSFQKASEARLSGIHKPGAVIVDSGFAASPAPRNDEWLSASPAC